MNSAEHQILTRISFAERWLQRAREECLDGDVGRGLLTLVMADAEVRRLLQLAVPPAPRARASMRPAVVVAAGVLIAALAAVQLGMFALRAPVQSAGLAPGLTLRPGTGALLESLQGQQPTEVAVAAPQVPARAAAPPSTPSRARVPLAKPTAVSRVPSAPAVPVQTPAVRPSPLPAPTAAPVVAASPAPSPVPAASQAEPADSTLSLADLLDLVIVADRTLRRSQP